MSIPNHDDNRSQRSAKRYLAILFILMLSMTAVVTSVSAISEGAAADEVGNSASIWLDGPIQAEPGDVISYNITTDATGLYGVELGLSFDTAVLQVVGTEVTPGSCPQGDFIVTNSVDNITGTLLYAATSLNPTLPCDGGVVASFQFQVSPTAAEGTTQVQFAKVILADFNGSEIPVTAVDQDLEIVVDVLPQHWLSLPVILR
jgi:hypothetical protein